MPSRKSMFKDYHIIVVPDDKARTKSFKISALTLKVLVSVFVLSIPLFFVSVLTTIHYQNKVVDLKRTNYENKKLVETKAGLIKKLTKLEKTLSLMDDSISHLSELMDIDPQSLKFGTGPIGDLDFTLEDDFEESFQIPETDKVIEEWINENGSLTVNKFNRKYTAFKDEATVLNKKLEEIFLQNRDKINFVNSSPNVLPVEGWITSEFGVRRHPIAHRFKMHNGIDVASPKGTPVKSPANGKVIFSGRSGGYGNVVIVQHGYGVSTMYAHLYAVHVKTGDTIKKLDVLGEVGTTGYSTGPHLHYEVRVDGIPKDPLSFLVQ